jgi:hypothetical protein
MIVEGPGAELAPLRAQGFNEGKGKPEKMLHRRGNQLHLRNWVSLLASWPSLRPTTREIIPDP